MSMMLHRAHLPLLLTSILVTMTASHALKIAIITGSTRTSGPPRPILGPRVAKFMQHQVQARGHTITATIHPHQLPLLEKPHFAYSASQVPPEMQKMHDALKEADAYVTITPELNHAPSPGLVNTLNHFGSSVFAFKPSVIVSYSPSQWGGVRAAHSLRPILSELGCLPVSSMIHFPKCHEVLQEDGSATDDQWFQYSDRSLAQLEWWAEATKQQRAVQDPHDQSPTFQTDPTQRNAPS